MKCPECSEETASPGIFTTLVGYSSFTDDQGRLHEHDDNCLKRYYRCVNGHEWSESKRRHCKHGDWDGKAECGCHKGQKVEQWTDAPHDAEIVW